MPIEIIACEQNDEAWTRARIGIPTASAFGDILAKGEGKTRACYMRRLAGEIITKEPAENFKNGATDRGHVMEAEMRAKYAFLHDAEPVQVGFIRNGEKGCSPDALIGTAGILEIKTERPDILIETLLKNEFPSKHKAQTQGALWVCEREWVDIMIGYSGMPSMTKRAYRDAQYIVALARAVEEFNAELNELVEKIKAYR